MGVLPSPRLAKLVRALPGFHNRVSETVSEERGFHSEFVLRLYLESHCVCGDTSF